MSSDSSLDVRKVLASNLVSMSKLLESCNICFSQGEYQIFLYARVKLHNLTLANDKIYLAYLIELQQFLGEVVEEREVRRDREFKQITPINGH